MDSEAPHDARKNFNCEDICNLAIYLMQLFNFNLDHFKKKNHLLYKVIWNRHYLAAKAPERVKREYTNTPVSLGGLGMLDVVDLDKGLK